MKMVPRLYYDDKSTGCRAVLLTVNALNLTLALQMIDVTNKEDLTDEFITKNPQQTIPVLIDEDLTICDSHEILKYLVEKYAIDFNLYPNDEDRREIIDKRLNFNANILLPSLHNLLFPIVTLGEKEILKENLIALKEVYFLLNKCLEDNEYVAGDKLSIADLSCAASISTGSIILPVSSELYPKLFKWYQKCRALPYYDKANSTGLRKLDALIETKLGSAYEIKFETFTRSDINVARKTMSFFILGCMLFLVLGAYWMMSFCVRCT